jgi:hypothetical protein
MRRDKSRESRGRLSGRRLQGDGLMADARDVGHPQSGMYVGCEGGSFAIRRRQDVRLPTLRRKGRRIITSDKLGKGMDDKQQNQSIHTNCSLGAIGEERESVGKRVMEM